MSEDKWLYRASEEHQCKPPNKQYLRRGKHGELHQVAEKTSDPDGRVGDIWECRCGNIWVIDIADDGVILRRCWCKVPPAKYWNAQELKRKIRELWS